MASKLRVNNLVKSNDGCRIKKHYVLDKTFNLINIKYYFTNMYKGLVLI